MVGLLRFSADDVDDVIISVSIHEREDEGALRSGSVACFPYQHLSQHILEMKPREGCSWALCWNLSGSDERKRTPRSNITKKNSTSYCSFLRQFYGLNKIIFNAI